MKRRERRAATGGPSPTLPGGSDAATPAALREAGLGLMRAERYLEAQMCCQQALALDPDHAGAQHLMGLLSIQSQQYDHAIEWISRAIHIPGDEASYWSVELFHLPSPVVYC